MVGKGSIAQRLDIFTTVQEDTFGDDDNDDDDDRFVP